MKVFPEANITQYRNRLEERTDPAALRNSPQRADHLSRVGAILAKSDVRVHLSPQEQTATIVSTGSHYPTDPDQWRIQIATREFPQPVTGYSREAYDLLIQETLLVHEIGHVLYTDYGALRDAAKTLDPADRLGFGILFNAAEDIAVEAQLRAQFSVTEELRVLNANLLSSVSLSSRELSLLQAVELAILELGVWNTGRLDLLLSNNPDVDSADTLSFRSAEAATRFEDDMLPLIERLVSDITKTPIGSDRVELVREFWETLQDHLSETNDDRSAGENDYQSINAGKPDDVDVDRDDTGEPAMALADEPADRDTSDPEDASSTADNHQSTESVDSTVADQAATNGASSNPASDDEAGSTGAPPDEPNSGTDSDGFSDPRVQSAEESNMDTRSAHADHHPSPTPETREDIESSYQSEAASTAQSIQSANETLSDEVSALMASLTGAGSEFEGIEFDVPLEQPGTYDETTYAYATRLSGWIAQELGDRLRLEERQRPLKRRPTGRLDGGRLANWQRGEYRIFERRQTGGDKDYTAMLVADRSSSMGGVKISMMEQSLGGLALGLEAIGVRSAIMDLYQEQGRLVKPFDIPVESRRSLLFSGKIGGETPLEQVLAVARERLERAGGNQFLILITDGQIQAIEEFKSQVARCNFPVLGIYLGAPFRNMAEMAHMQPSFVYDEQLELFDRYRVVFDQSALDRTLIGFCREFLF